MIYQVIRSFIALAVISLFVACSGPSQQKTTSGRGTIADARLQSDVMRMISIYESAAGGSSCPQLISAEFLGKKGETYAERWVVESNGKSILYSVELTPNPRGGVDYAIARTP